VARIEVVTLDDLVALTRELWSPERLSSAGIGPDQGRYEEALVGALGAGVV
jgi:predicted Zn-dependent peptidase